MRMSTGTSFDVAGRIHAVLTPRPARLRPNRPLLSPGAGVKNIWRAIHFIPEYRGRIVGVIALGVLMGIIGTSTPYIYKAIVDVIAGLIAGRASHAQAATSVLELLGLFLALRLGTIVFTALQVRQADHLWLDTVSTFRQRVFENMTRLSIDYFEKTRAGEIMDRFGAITTVTMWLNSLTEGTLSSIIQMFFVIGVLLWRAPAIGLLMSAVLVLNFTISFRSMRWTKPYRRGWQKHAGKMAGLLAEMIGNIATVRSFGGESAVKQRYDETQAEWRVDRGMLHRIQWWSALALSVVNTLGVFIAVALTARSALAGHLTAGDILLVLTLSQSLISTVGPISRQINQTADIDATAERLVDLLEVDQELADRPDAIELDELRTVAFEHVTFRYPGKLTPALDDVSFALRTGRDTGAGRAERQRQDDDRQAAHALLRSQRGAHPDQRPRSA